MGVRTRHPAGGRCRRRGQRGPRERRPPGCPGRHGSRSRPRVFGPQAVSAHGRVAGRAARAAHGMDFEVTCRRTVMERSRWRGGLGGGAGLRASSTPVGGRPGMGAGPACSSQRPVDPAPRMRRDATDVVGACGSSGEQTVPSLLKRWQAEDDPATRLGVSLALGQLSCGSPRACTPPRSSTSLEQHGELDRDRCDRCLPAADAARHPCSAASMYAEFAWRQGWLKPDRCWMPRHTRPCGTRSPLGPARQGVV